MTRWEIRKERGSYVAHGPACAAPASVPTHWAMWHAEIRVGEAAWPVRVTDRGHRAIVAGPGGDTVVRLHQDGSRILGTSAPVRWSGGHRGGVLKVGDATVSVSRRGRLVEVVGDWPFPELIVMAARRLVESGGRRAEEPGPRPHPNTKGSFTSPGQPSRCAAAGAASANPTVRIELVVIDSDTQLGRSYSAGRQRW